MRDRLPMIVSLVVFVLGGWAFYAMSRVASRGGEQSPLYSVRRHDPFGTAALRELLVARGLDVRTLERSRPAADDAGVLIQVLETPPDWEWPGRRSRLQPGPLLDWIRDGNTVIQLAPGRTKLMDRCGVPAEIAPSGSSWSGLEDRMRAGRNPDDPGWYAVASTWSDEGEAFPGPSARPRRGPVVHAPWTLPGQAQGGWLPLALIPAGGTSEAVVGAQQVGAGRLIVVTSPSPALNGTLGDGGNLEMLLALVGDGPVLIDEWSHGIGHGGTIVGLIANVGLLPVLLQTALAVLLYAWSNRGSRRASVDPPRRRRAAAEQIVTLGHLYRQVLSSADIAARSRQEARRRAAAALRCPVSMLSERLGSQQDQAWAAAVRAEIDDDGLLARPLCPQCSYDLTGNETGTCPECGTPVAPALARHVAGGRSKASDKDAGRRRVEMDAVRRLHRIDELIRRKDLGAGADLSSFGERARSI
ncbi:MAG: hypothetical protein CMJ18_04360 [Phycisphaeraceae bacterium]|nr:hypothetical protein [Phycisphaeraceae bacterium]